VIHVKRQAPLNLEFTILDINANHKFKHIGKKDKKQIFYRGWNGELLPRDAFEAIALCGCMACSRKPKWGNEIMFIDKDHFLCEFCTMDQPLVRTWLGLAPGAAIPDTSQVPSHTKH
jgi:hypothetical protein